MSFNDIYLPVLPWICFDVFQMVAVPENDLKLNCFGLAVYFHWWIHSVSHLEHCGASGYIPATIPSFRVFTIQLGDLIIWCQMPGVHLCHTDNLCHRKPKGSIGLGSGDIWASSGKKNLAKPEEGGWGHFPRVTAGARGSDIVIFGGPEAQGLSEARWIIMARQDMISLWRT